MQEMACLNLKLRPESLSSHLMMIHCNRLREHSSRLTVYDHFTASRIKNPFPWLHKSGKKRFKLFIMTVTTLINLQELLQIVTKLNQ